MSQNIVSAGKRRSLAWLIVKIISLAVLVSVLVGSIVAVSYVRSCSKNLPSIKNLTKQQQLATRIIDRNGLLIGEIGNELRTIVSYDDLPKKLVDAAVAAEDKRFWKHHGVDWIATSWITLKCLAKAGHDCRGASTITQQVAKNYLVGDEHSVRRKVREMILAWRIESKYSKEEILELYFNKNCYGHRRFGVEAASNLFFGKSVKQLDDAEAAMLIALQPNPVKYSPISHYDVALAKTRLVLRRMRAERFLTKAEYKQAKEKTPRIVPMRAEGSSAALVVCDKVRKWLAESYSQAELEQLGLTIQVTIDLRLQVLALKLLQETVAKIASNHGYAKAPEGTVVVIDPQTREILAMVGGANYKPDGTNRAYAMRPPGSTFKTFVFAESFASGRYNPFTEFGTAKVIYLDNGNEWTPGNFEGEMENAGNMSIIMAYAHSLNTVTVEAMCGLDANAVFSQPYPIKDCRAKGIVGNVITFVENLGIKLTAKAKAELNPSIAIGTELVSPIRLVNAYATFFSDGRYAEPIFVKRVFGKGKLPKVLELEWSPNRLDRNTVDSTLSLMRAVVTDGTARKANGKLPEEVYGKTGTTATDAWFVGGTKRLAAVVRIGYDDNRPLGQRETGASAALPLWVSVMSTSLGGQPVNMVSTMNQRPTADADTGEEASTEAVEEESSTDNSAPEEVQPSTDDEPEQPTDSQ